MTKMIHIPSILGIAALLLVVPFAHASDCLEHPQLQYQIRLLKCTELDESTLSLVSRHSRALPSDISSEPVQTFLEKNQGMVLLGRVLRKKVIAREEADAAWGQIEEKQEKYFVVLGLRSCKAYQDDTMLELLVRRDCSCDTLPPQGRCWIDQDALAELSEPHPAAE